MPKFKVICYLCDPTVATECKHCGADLHGVCAKCLYLLHSECDLCRFIARNNCYVVEDPVKRLTLDQALRALQQVEVLTEEEPTSGALVQDIKVHQAFVVIRAALNAR